MAGIPRPGPKGEVWVQGHRKNVRFEKDRAFIGRMSQLSQDLQWLRAYATEGCEKSFAAVVQQHHRLVYSAALRQVGDTVLAEEITQAVFVILARKAGSLSNNTILAGWLFRTTRFVAAHAKRDQVRRQKYEKEAAQMNPDHLEPELAAAWDEIAPVLDDALARLATADRHAILLRYFERKELKEVGFALGSTEEAARKRVTRALTKLHKFLTRRGVVLTTGLLAAALTTQAVQAAPSSLPLAITALVAAKGGSTATLTLVKASMKAMFYAKLQPAAICGAALMLAVGAGALVAQQAAKPQQRVVFEENFEGGTLDQWAGNLHGAHNGIIVPDPLRPQNHVLTFAALSTAGDLFTLTPILIANTNRQYVVSFDYLGLAQEGSLPGNLGGFLGIAASIDDWEHNRVWVAGTEISALTPPLGVKLVDDGTWHHYEIDISPWIQEAGLTVLHLMIEDWRDLGGVPGDAYFDNIRMVMMHRREPNLQVHVTEITACWESETNQNYQVQYRSAMSQGGWTDVGGPVAGNGGTNCVSDHVPLQEAQRFYRVVRVP